MNGSSSRQPGGVGSTAPLPKAADSADPAVSVIIPAWCCAADLERCVRAAETAYCDGPVEIIVVDDHSEPPLEPLVSSERIRWIRQPERAGPAPARNTGARHARGRFLVFIDADVVISPDVLDLLLAPVRAGTADAAQGVYDPSPGSDDVCARFWTYFQNYKTHAAGAGRLGSASTQMLACTRDFFLQSGGLCELLGPDEMFEDIEWSSRMTTAGAVFVRVPEARGLHLRAFTAGSYFRYHAGRTAAKVRLHLGLRHFHGDVVTPPLIGVPRERGLPLVLGTVPAAGVAIAALGAALVDVTLRPAFVWATLSFLALFLASHASLLLFVARTASPQAALGAVPLSWYTAIAHACGIAVGLIRHLRRPFELPRPGEPAPALRAVDSSEPEP